MSYTARPPFAGGMSNQNQQQQQGGQPNNSNIGTTGIPNIQMMNNAASIPGNHMASSSTSPAMSVIDQKIFQQQLLLQRQLLMQGQQYQQQQPSQPNQQAKFQQQTSQTPLNRLVSEMLNDKNGSNLAQQTQQQLQHIAQLQALTNMMQLQQAVQQKSFQQQAVPLPTNTTITPVARQNMQAMQKQPTNYPRSNVPNKNLTQNVNASPMQSRKSFPNAPKSTVPPLQSAMVATPLNISSASSKSNMPQMPSAMAAAANSAKGYADILAASLSSAQSSMNITPSLTITKTNSPSSSTSYAKNTAGLPNKPVSTISTSQKSFLPEAISMSLGNVPISVKASQAPSITVTPTNKPASSPTNRPIPATPLKTNSPQNVTGLQKLSPTSPRTKQTPRKNTNPIRTTSLSPATQTSSQSGVPHVDAKPTNPSISPSSVKQSVASPTIAANTTPVKPSNATALPVSSPKASVTVSNLASASVSASVSASASGSKVVAKSLQPTTVNNSNVAEAKPNATVAQKTSTAPTLTPVKSELVKVEEVKSNDIKIESKPDKTETLAQAEPVKVAKAVKSEETLKSEKPPVVESSATPTAQNKSIESKSKPNTTIPESAANQSASKVKENKGKADTMAKTIVAKVPKAAPTTPIQSSADGRVKRNRFKTVHYQSPTPEFELVSKISANEAINAHKKKAAKAEEDKLTLFYKNEFLAVRNAEGGFYLCQAMNNVYKSSPKIRIRWLSEDLAKKNIYGLDFYDHTDIECVLTSVSLNKMAKGKFELTKTECDRIESILKKALDVEKGIVEKPDVTEENPDGLDLSLYTDESQIEKKMSAKRKLSDKTDKLTPVAKRPKAEAKTSAKKTSANSSKSASAKKSHTPGALAKGANEAKANASVDIQSTPVSKRITAKRKLTDEPAETDDSSKDTSKNEEAEKKVSKIEGESPKAKSEKIQTGSDSDGQSSRSTRRSRN